MPYSYRNYYHYKSLQLNILKPIV